MSILEYYDSQNVDPEEERWKAEENLRETFQHRHLLVVSMLWRFTYATAFLVLSIAYGRERDDVTPTYLAFILVVPPILVFASVVSDIGNFLEYNKKIKQLKTSKEFWRSQSMKYHAEVEKRQTFGLTRSDSRE